MLELGVELGAHQDREGRDLEPEERHHHPGDGAVGLLILVALAAIYRYAPSRDEPRWTWLGLGSFVAAGLCMIASILLSYYAETFGTLR